MDKIIEELIQIENRAKRHLTEVNEAKNKLPQRIQASIAVIQAEIDEDTKQKIRLMTTNAYDEADVRIRTIQKLSQEQFSNLEKHYINNATQWQNQIFNNVLGR